MRQPYPDDLSDDEWERLAPILNSVKKIQGRPPKYPRREVLNALFYLLRTGCSWRHLPHDFHPWKSVFAQFSQWKKRGVFEEVHHILRKDLRVLEKKDEEPSAAIIDSQSVKTTEKGGSKDMTVESILKVGSDMYLLTLTD